MSPTTLALGLRYLIMSSSLSTYFLLQVCSRYPSDFADFSEEYKGFLANFMLAQMDSFEFGDQVVASPVGHTLFSSWFHLFEKDNPTFYVFFRELVGSSGRRRLRRTVLQSGISCSCLSRVLRLLICVRGRDIVTLTCKLRDAMINLCV